MISIAKVNDIEDAPLEFRRSLGDFESLKAELEEATEKLEARRNVLRREYDSIRDLQCVLGRLLEWEAKRDDKAARRATAPDSVVTSEPVPKGDEAGSDREWRQSLA